MEIETKMKAGKYMIPVSLWTEGKRIFFKFGFNRPLMEEIKAMEGSKFHGYDEVNPRKLWSVTDTPRNHFQIQYLQYPGVNDIRNPYYRYNIPLQHFQTKRNVYSHQGEMVDQILTRHYDIIAAEMGTGKTLACIEAIEISKAADVIWVAPKSALYSVMLEFKKWNSDVFVQYYTYEGLKKLIENWSEGRKAPQFVVLDEASRCKNPTAQRAQAAQYLSDNVRKEWGQDGYVIELSGTPAPKDPTDWWSLSEIACPGFLREGTREKLKRRLAVIEQRESFQGGGFFQSLVTWKDDILKCNICGLLKDDETHITQEEIDRRKAEANKEKTAEEAMFGADDQESDTCHVFQQSVDEISLLYKRLQGLVLVKLKKDMLDLPDMVYREIELKPTLSMVNAAKAVQSRSTSAIQALTYLRELSDGFQYIETICGTETCTACNGSKVITGYLYKGEQKVSENMYKRIQHLTNSEVQESEEEREWDPDYVKEILSSGNFNPDDFVKTEIACDMCSGIGLINKTKRDVKEVPTPKEEALRDILTEHDDIGRIVIYGGFTGSLDKICKLVANQGWLYIRVDGRGWFSTIPGSATDLLEIFQSKNSDLLRRYPKIAFVGQPGAAGMGITLTASPTIVYYSNDFNAESRIQSEARIHRLGMDTNRGATIIDLLCLPSDRLVLENLKKKRKLQDMTMGVLKSAFELPIEVER